MDAVSVVLDPVVVRALGAAMAVIFIAGALAKLRDVELFRHAVDNYRLLGDTGSELFARVFPALELAAGLLLLLEATRLLGMLVGLGVLAVATGGVAINLLRGRNAIECGCGTGGQRISWGLVARNAALAVALVLGAAEGAARALGALDYFSLAGTVLGLLALYACVNQLLANQPLLKELQS